MASETNYPRWTVHGSHVLEQQPSECLNRYAGLLDPGPSKQSADWIAPTATSHVYRTCGHWAIVPRPPMCKLFTIYMGSIDIARRVLVRKYLLKIGYQPITSTVFGRTPWHRFLLPAPVCSAHMHVRQDSVYKLHERPHSSSSRYRIGT
jgi:hypothetical protein